MPYYLYKLLWACSARASGGNRTIDIFKITKGEKMRYLRVLISVLCAASVIAYAGLYIVIKMGMDTTPPEITDSLGEIEVSVTATDSELKKGLSARDDSDGDVTDSMIVGNRSKFTDSGVCTMEYIAFDKSNNVSSYKRQVKFTDYHPPRFTLGKSLVYQTGRNITLLERIGAADVFDGDISDNISIISSNISLIDRGDYSITVKTSNSSGDESRLELPVHFTVSDELQYDVHLSDYIVYVPVGTAIDPTTYFEGVSARGKSLVESSIQCSVKDIAITGTVDANTPGVYEICYRYTAPNGKSGISYLVVVVEAER